MDSKRLEEVLGSSFELTHEAGLKQPSKDWFWPYETLDEDFEKVIATGAVNVQDKMNEAIDAITLLHRESLIKELKDAKRTFKNSANQNYTGQQVHQVLEARLSELRESGGEK